MVAQSQPHSSLAELLDWYKHAGVDIALSDIPVDHFAAFKQQSEERMKAAQKPKPVQLSPARMQEAAIPDEKVIASARAQAITANTLDELRELLEKFKGCNLRLSAKKLVFADGNPQADIMLVGGAPGADEDSHGLPFIGPTGQLLDKMLGAINLDRDKVYISNVIPWRPPGNRTPTPAEIQICRPFIERHIELVSPKVLILLGGTSAKTLLNTTDGIMKLRGKWQKYKLPGSDTTKEVDCLPTLHPTYLIKHPLQKRLAWQDLLQVRAKVG